MSGSYLRMIDGDCIALTVPGEVKKSTPTRSTEIGRRRPNLNGQGCEATAGCNSRDGGDVHAGTLLLRR